MTIEELKNKTQTELHRLLAEGRDELRELRFRVSGRQLSGVRRIRATKVRIARILTMINAKPKS